MDAAEGFPMRPASESASLGTHKTLAEPVRMKRPANCKLKVRPIERFTAGYPSAPHSLEEASLELAEAKTGTALAKRS